MNGHTSSVSVPGSDETDADQRERWRRMRVRRGIENWESLSAEFRPRRNDRQRDGCRVYFVARIGFRQRMRWGRFMLACSRATGLVSAASWLASLLNWRAGE